MPVTAATRLVFAAVYCFSIIGDELALIALTVRVHGATHQPLAVGLLFCAALVPLILFSPVAGYLVDRFETVRLVVVITAGQAIVVALMPLAGPLPTLLVLVALLNVGTAVVAPATLTLVPVAVGESTATSGYSVLEGTRAIGGVLGLALGGALTVLLGPGTLLVLDAASFALLSAVLLATGLRRQATSAPERTGLWRGWRRGSRSSGPIESCLPPWPRSP